MRVIGNKRKTFQIPGICALSGHSNIQYLVLTSYNTIFLYLDPEGAQESRRQEEVRLRLRLQRRGVGRSQEEEGKS